MFRECFSEVGPMLSWPSHRCEKFVPMHSPLQFETLVSHPFLLRRGQIAQIPQRMAMSARQLVRAEVQRLKIPLMCARAL